MKQFLGIATATFREAVRNKILYSILFFAIVVIVLAMAIGDASLSQDVRVVRNVGRAALHFFSDVIAIFIGVTMVYQEVQRKTIYNVLSKPVSRHTYFFGKFAGMAFTLLVQNVVMTGVLCAAMAMLSEPITGVFIGGAMLAYVESLLVLSFALFFASFSTPYVSGFLTLGVTVVGALIQNLSAYLTEFESALGRAIARWLVAAAPDLSLFSVSTQLAHGYPIPPSYFVQAAAYGFCYAGVFLVVGSVIFSRRDFV